MLRIIMTCCAILAGCGGLFASAGMARAQDLPGLYSVTGVASNDVLNVRAGPSGSAGIVSTLPHTATGVEVTALSGNWGRVNVTEGTGWVSMTFMTPQAGGTLPEVAGLSCFGTEPFWSFRVTQGGNATFTDPMSNSSISLLAGQITRAWGRPDKYGLAMTAPQLHATMALTQLACNDGMSDNQYGVSVDVIMFGSQSKVLSGCCLLQAN